MLDRPYVYVFVRKDIHPVQQLVQVGHACLEAGFSFTNPQTPSSLVLISVKNERELLQVRWKLEDHGIKSHVFFEPDNSMGFSALCTRPVFGEEREIFKEYQLYK